MNKMLQSVAQDISESLALEVAAGSYERGPMATTVEILAQDLAEEVVSRVHGLVAAQGPPIEELDARLRSMEVQLEGLMGEEPGEAEYEEDEDEDEDEVPGGGSRYPNLKYAKRKYKSMDSVLKYIDSQSENGGVKLVIMNFND